ncbi:MAG TPA: hypothetical protein VKH81_07090 [Candidatus Angelobacter sp.]|nr:hypothetical protein [Candidatus Angelobacter sp.]
MTAVSISFGVGAECLNLQWTYKPYEVRGEAVEVESTVRVEFRIDGAAKAD